MIGLEKMTWGESGHAPINWSAGTCLLKRSEACANLRERADCQIDGVFQFEAGGECECANRGDVGGCRARWAGGGFYYQAIK